MTPVYDDVKAFLEKYQIPVGVFGYDIKPYVFSPPSLKDEDSELDVPSKLVTLISKSLKDERKKDLILGAMIKEYEPNLENALKIAVKYFKYYFVYYVIRKTKYILDDRSRESILCMELYQNKDWCLLADEIIYEYGCDRHEQALHGLKRMDKIKGALYGTFCNAMHDDIYTLVEMLPRIYDIKDPIDVPKNELLCILKQKHNKDLKTGCNDFKDMVMSFIMNVIYGIQAINKDGLIFIRMLIRAFDYFSTPHKGALHLLDNFADPHAIFKLFDINIYKDINTNPIMLSNLIIRNVTYCWKLNLGKSDNGTPIYDRSSLYERSYLDESRNYIEYMDMTNMDPRYLFIRDSELGFDLITIALLRYDLKVVLYLANCPHRNFDLTFEVPRVLRTKLPGQNKRYNLSDFVISNADIKTTKVDEFPEFDIEMYTKFYKKILKLKDPEAISDYLKQSGVKKFIKYR